MEITEAKAQQFRFAQQGDTLTGRLMDVYKTEFGGNAYDLQGSNGDTFYFFGSTQLDRLLAEKMGKLVSIAFQGTRQTKKGRTMKLFEVTTLEEPKDDLPMEE